MKSLGHVQLFATPRTVACQAPPFMGFSRQEYWSGLPFPSPEDLPDTGIEPGSSALFSELLIAFISVFILAVELSNVDWFLFTVSGSLLQ